MQSLTERSIICAPQSALADYRTVLGLDLAVQYRAPSPRLSRRRLRCQSRGARRGGWILDVANSPICFDGDQASDVKGTVTRRFAHSCQHGATPGGASTAGRRAAHLGDTAPNALRWKLRFGGGRVATGAPPLGREVYASAVRKMATADKPALGRHPTADAATSLSGSGEGGRGRRADCPSRATAGQFSEGSHVDYARYQPTRGYLSGSSLTTLPFPALPSLSVGKAAAHCVKPWKWLRNRDSRNAR
ncbi:hypothetical protein SAMN03159463_05955 [Mesorhizobium sp. NFR06]|nr:hypothetical protein SAMN03159463_05955 [Mesorhizobium sp. NFR06]